VSLLEGIPFGTANKMLDDAIKWIDTSAERRRLLIQPTIVL
jgi:hypothetical protein